jgi:hypothetical protein
MVPPPRPQYHRRGRRVKRDLIHPAALAQFLLGTLPHIAHPAAYLLWCAAQDFVFFSLVQRDLEDLSHYPYTGLIALTGLAALAWGAVFRLWRSLPLVTASHWVLGVFALG